MKIRKSKRCIFHLFATDACSTGSGTRFGGCAGEYARRYPDMPVTVIDYDPESSALNRENRIRLAVEAAQQAKNKG